MRLLTVHNEQNNHSSRFYRKNWFCVETQVDIQTYFHVIQTYISLNILNNVFIIYLSLVRMLGTFLTYPELAQKTCFLFIATSDMRCTNTLIS